MEDRRTLHLYCLFLFFGGKLLRHEAIFVVRNDERTGFPNFFMEL